MNLNDLERRTIHLRAEFEHMPMSVGQSTFQMPKVERSLSQMKHVSNQMVANMSNSEQMEIKASLLMAEHGFELSRKPNKVIEAFNTPSYTQDIPQPMKYFNITEFLQKKRQSTIITAINETNMHTIDESERRHKQAVNDEWQREKMRVLQSLSAQEHHEIDLSPAAPEVLMEGQNHMNMQGRSQLNHLEMLYAEMIKVYNNSTLEGKEISIIDHFVTGVKVMKDKRIEEIWDVTKAVIDVTPSLTTKQALADNYDDDAPFTDEQLIGRYSHAANCKLIQNSKDYMEKIYFDSMQAEINSNSLSMRPDCNASVVKIFAFYYNVRYSHIEFLPEDKPVYECPVWGLLFIALRAGEREACLNIADYLKQSCPQFYQMFMEYINSNGNLSSELEREVKLSYFRTVRNCLDPFKRIIYCIMGKCEEEDHDRVHVLKSVDDLLWLKLSQIPLEKRSLDDSMMSNQTSLGLMLEPQLTLPLLQVKFAQELGEQFFKVDDQPLVYFRMLMLTGQFELAIEHLFRNSQYRCHAVHIAITMYELKLLLIPKHHQAKLLTSDPRLQHVHFLNFTHLLLMYARRFIQSDVEEAVNYYYFLRNITSVNTHENIFKLNIVKIICENENQFSFLLGRFTEKGKLCGLLHKFIGDLSDTTVRAAEEMESIGKPLAAINLYDLAQSHEKVLDILIGLLSEVIDKPNGPHSAREQLVHLGNDIADRYKNSAINPCNLAVFFTLLNLDMYFSAYHRQDYSQAYSLICKMMLLPQKESQMQTRIDSVSRIPDKIRVIYPSVLIAYMRILQLQYNSIANDSSKLSLVKDQQTILDLNKLKNEARLICLFANKIPYKIPSDILKNMRDIEINMKL